jgi:peptide/nickel transport system permease protein
VSRSRYILHRVIYLLPVLFFMSIIIFSFLHLIPGDPVDFMLGETGTGEQRVTLRSELGLDRPILVQYLTWAEKMLKGDLGTSIITRQPVLSTILEKLPASLLLASTSACLSFLMALLLGTIAGANRGSFKDLSVLVVALLWVSVPIFWLGILLILAFSIYFPLFPSIGYTNIFHDFWGGLHHLFLPAVTLGAQMTGAVTRVTRSEMIEQLSKDYVTTAWAKGLARRAIFYRHALKNALIPVVTLTGLQLGSMIGGSLVVETIFAWPGVGSLLMYSIFARDYVMVQGTILFIAGIFVLINLLVDISYTFLNPQISLGTKR